MSEEKVPYGTSSEKDTSPMIRSRRIKRPIRIEERNDPPMPNTFDTTVEYSSDALPEWFKGLQSVVEDETFTGMVITLGGGRVRYHISLANEVELYNQEVDKRNRKARENVEKPWLPVYDGE
jgi:hypothetical protein